MWLAYRLVEPWGEDRADLRIGYLTSLTANVHRDSKRKPQPFSPSDFRTKPDSIEERKAEGITHEKWKAWKQQLIATGKKIDIGQQSG
jgi:hypothetical protein